MEGESFHKRIEQLITCGICLERLKQPKTLACEHSFCQKCLEITFDKSESVLFCPTCRKRQSYISEKNDIFMLTTSLHLKQTIDVFPESTVSQSSGVTDEEYRETKFKNGVQSISFNETDNDNGTHSKHNVTVQYNESCDSVSNGSDADNDDDLKKHQNHSEDDSEPDLYNRRPFDNVKQKKSGKKRSFFGRLSRKLFGLSSLYDDLDNIDRLQREVLCQNCVGLGKGACTCEGKDSVDNKIAYNVPDKADAIKALPKCCTPCGGTGHAAASCKSVQTKTNSKELSSTKRVAAVGMTGFGVGYASEMKSGSLMHQKTKYGMYSGYGGRVATARKKSAPRQRRTTKGSSSTGRGMGSGFVGFGKKSKRGVMFIL